MHTEDFLYILMMLYIVVGFGLAYWSAFADKQARKFILTDNNLYKIITLICICLWPFLILFYIMFKKQIDAAKGDQDSEKDQ